MDKDTMEDWPVLGRILDRSTFHFLACKDLLFYKDPVHNWKAVCVAGCVCVCVSLKDMAEKGRLGEGTGATGKREPISFLNTLDE